MQAVLAVEKRQLAAERSMMEGERQEVRMLPLLCLLCLLCSWWSCAPQ